MNHVDLISHFDFLAMISLFGLSFCYLFYGYLLAQNCWNDHLGSYFFLMCRYGINTNLLISTFSKSFLEFIMKQEMN